MKNRILPFIPASAISLLSAISVFAQEQEPSQPGFPGGIIPMMVIMFAIIYFLMIRPEQKKQKARQNMIKNVKKGDKVVTLGGIYGVVNNIKENTVMVKVTDSTVLELTKSAISSVLSDEDIGESDQKEKKK